MSQHTLVNDRSEDEYLFDGWRWNEGRYAVHRGLRDIVDTLNKVCQLPYFVLCA